MNIIRAQPTVQLLSPDGCQTLSRRMKSPSPVVTALIELGAGLAVVRHTRALWRPFAVLIVLCWAIALATCLGA